MDNTNGQCEPLNWGTQNFWQITNQTKWDWHDLICSNETRPELGSIRKPSGEDWCICMWATEGLINKVTSIMNRYKVFLSKIFLCYKNKTITY